MTIKRKKGELFLRKHFEALVGTSCRLYEVSESGKIYKENITPTCKIFILDNDKDLSFKAPGESPGLTRRTHTEIGRLAEIGPIYIRDRNREYWYFTNYWFAYALSEQIKTKRKEEV